MKTLLEKLGLKSKSDKKIEANSQLGTEILAKLNGIDEEKVRFLAAFGGLLGIIANADGEIDEAEDRRIKAILKTFSGLEENEAEVVQQIIHEQTKSLAGLENHIYTREINELADFDKKLEILSCLFAMAAADDDISGEENEEVRRIAKALLLTHDDFISIRSLYKDKLSVLKNLPGK